MTSINEAAFWGTLGLMIAFLYGPWQVFWADWFRQEAFAARDELFDFGLRDQTVFENRDYQLARVAINSMIANAERYTWPHILAIIFATNPRSIDRHENELSKDRSQSAYDLLVSQTNKSLILSIVLRAPFVWPLASVVGLYGLWRIGARGLVGVADTNADFMTRLGQRATAGITAH